MISCAIEIVLVSFIGIALRIKPLTWIVFTELNKLPPRIEDDVAKG
jgi:hypothetical protein